MAASGRTPLGHFWASLVGQTVLLAALALRARPAPRILTGEARRHLAVAAAGWLAFGESHPARRLISAALGLGGVSLLVV